MSDKGLGSTVPPPPTVLRTSVSASSILNPNYTGPPGGGDDRTKSGSDNNPSPDVFLSPIPSEGVKVTEAEGVKVKVTQSPAVVPVTAHTTISVESLKKGQGQVVALDESDNEMAGGDLADDTEQTPLLAPVGKGRAQTQDEKVYSHSQAYQKVGEIPGESTRPMKPDFVLKWPNLCWCWQNHPDQTPPPHPVPSMFTNDQFRQNYAGQIFKVKVIQMLVCFLVTLASQLLWNLHWNEIYGTPPPILLLAHHRWLASIPLCLYTLLIMYVRLVTPEGVRGGPLDKVIFILSTVFLSLFGYALSLGFADIIPAMIVPVTFGSLLWSYFLFRRLVTSDPDGKLYIDVTSNNFYYAIVPVITSGALILWPIVYTVLALGNSVVPANETVLESLLLEGLPVIAIGGVVLLFDVYHIKGIFNGNRISIITHDHSEVIFASFFV